MYMYIYISSNKFLQNMYLLFKAMLINFNAESGSTLSLMLIFRYSCN